MYMNYLASHSPYGTFMPQPVSPLNQHGYQPFAKETTAHGPSSMSKTSTNIFHNQRKHNRDICGTNDKAHDPPNRHFLEKNLVHPSLN